MFNVLYFRGGTRIGVWHAALPVTSAGEAEAQAVKTEGQGYPAVVVSSANVDLALSQLAVDYTPPTAWWDFAMHKRLHGKPGEVPDMTDHVEVG